MTAGAEVLEETIDIPRRSLIHVNVTAADVVRPHCVVSCFVVAGVKVRPIYCLITGCDIQCEEPSTEISDLDCVVV